MNDCRTARTMFGWLSSFRREISRIAVDGTFELLIVKPAARSSDFASGMLPGNIAIPSLFSWNILLICQKPNDLP